MKTLFVILAIALFQVCNAQVNLVPIMPVDGNSKQVSYTNTNMPMFFTTLANCNNSREVGRTSIPSSLNPLNMFDIFLMWINAEQTKKSEGVPETLLADARDYKNMSSYPASGKRRM